MKKHTTPNFVQDKGLPFFSWRDMRVPCPTPACRAQRVCALRHRDLGHVEDLELAGVDGLVVGYLQRRHERQLPATPATGDRPGRGLRLGQRKSTALGSES